MSKTIKSTGEETEITPKNGKYFSLEEMQEYVDGWIEMIWLPNNQVMIVNEEGLLNNLPLNAKASKICEYQVVGNVVICSRDMIK